MIPSLTNTIFSYLDQYKWFSLLMFCITNYIKLIKILKKDFHINVLLIIFSNIYIFAAALCLVSQLCRTLCNPMYYSPPGSSVHGDSPGRNTGVGFHDLLQGIFPTQKPNPHFLHCQWIFYHLRHQGSPRILELVT